MHVLDCLQHELNRLAPAHPEPRCLRVGDGERVTARHLLAPDFDHAPGGPRHVPVPADCEPRPGRCDCVCGEEQTLGERFGVAVWRHGLEGFIRADEDDLSDPAGACGRDDVDGPVHVGLRHLLRFLQFQHQLNLHFLYF